MDDAESIAALLAERTVGERIGFYVHVPYCARRCSYCDFVTYAPGEAGHRDPGRYRPDAIAEIDLAATLLARPQLPTVDTIYFGGGTPTLLPPSDLVAIVDHIRRRFPVAADVEVTTEANPDSVDRSSLAELRAGGFTRVSFGMQSAVPHVLEILGRSHRPERPVEAVAEARAAGFDHVGLDLIIGGPGESDTDWERSLDAVLSSGCDHVSAYGLIVEPRTPLAREVAAGRLSPADDAAVARRYRRTDERLTAAGFAWYEVSNWASSDGARSRHNRRYWDGADWWGVGPGAHGHLAGLRWSNDPNPGRWGDAVTAGQAPAAGHETLTDEQRRIEAIMLGVRTRTGIAISDATVGGDPADVDPAAITRLIGDGLADAEAAAAGRLLLTIDGRLLTDAVVRRLI